MRLAAAGLLAAACAMPPPMPLACRDGWPPALEGAGDDEAVAHVAGLAIDRARLERRRRADPPPSPGSAPKTLQAVVDDEVRFALILQAAYDRGLAADEEVVASLHEAMVRRLVERELAGQAAALVDDAAVERAYHAHQGQWVRAGRRQLDGAQWTGTAATTRAAAALADPAARDLRPAALASWRRVHGGHAVSRLEAGRWLTEEQLADALGAAPAAAAFAAPAPGPLAEVQACPAAACALVVLAEHQGQQRPLEEVREQIRGQLAQGTRQAGFEHFLAELRESYPVRLHAGPMARLAQAWEG